MIRKLKGKPSVKAFGIMSLSGMMALIFGENFTPANIGKIIAFSLFLSLIYDLILFNQDHKQQ